MGIYLNPKNEGFKESINSEIYVDKTGLIEWTNKYLCTEQKYICISRPRRFGKTMALKTLSAYYSEGCDSKKLFAGLKIENCATFQKHLNQYDVIYLDMTRFLRRARDNKVTEFLEREVLNELLDKYGELFSKKEVFLPAALEQIYIKTEKKFIFLIDEWDCIMRECQKSEELQRKYLDFLRDLLKNQSYIALVYMTGILPIKKYGNPTELDFHSALNMFTEYSMIDQDIFEEYTGFTEKEVKELCRRFDMNFEEVSNWYDGYSFVKFPHIYNPKSVVEAMRRHRCDSYWTITETYEAIKVYIDLNFDGLREDIIQLLSGNHVKVNTLTFQNDMWTFHTKDDVLTLLIHLGYLSYDLEKEETFIPNNEIIREFKNAISTGGWEEITAILNASEKLLNDTLNCLEKNVAKALDNAHTMVSSSLTYNREDSLACAIILAYFSARKDYQVIRELPTGYGFADIVFLPLPSRNKPAIIIELKYNKSANTAIKQIKDRNYVKALEGYVGELLLVGINYSKKTNKHTCKIERIGGSI